MEIGDLVAPRAGGYLMTVHEILGDKVVCLWFVGNQLYRDTFEIRELEKYVREADLPEACRAG